MAAEASGRAARVVAARLDEAEGTNAEAAEAPARTIRAESFIIDNWWMELNIIVKVGQRSEMVDGVDLLFVGAVCASAPVAIAAEPR